MSGKIEKTKPRPGLIPPHAILEVSKVLAHGAEKYSDHGWRSDPLWFSKNLDALGRHVLRWVLGEEFDEGSGCHPLAHAATRLLFLLERDLEERRERDEA